MEKECLVLNVVFLIVLDSPDKCQEVECERRKKEHEESTRVCCPGFDIHMVERNYEGVQRNHVEEPKDD
jgi:hypothetical protein